MRWYHKILIVLAIFIVPCSYKAQANKDKIEELRASFISKKLELSKAESEKFWPIYNEYQDKIKLLRKNLRQAYKSLPQNFSDKDADELILTENKTKLAEAELLKLYNEKLKQAIGSKKVVKLHIAEEEFKKEVINTIKEKQSD